MRGSWILAVMATFLAQACGGSEAVDTSNPAALTLTVFAGQNQSAVVGAEVPTDPTVRVVGANGEPSSVVVTFEITRGGGSILANVVPTGANGLAKAEHWVMGAPGPNTLKATLSLDSTQSVTFTATAIQAARGEKRDD